jgi:hypothetical protein
MAIAGGHKRLVDLEAHAAAEAAAGQRKVGHAAEVT